MKLMKCVVTFLVSVLLIAVLTPHIDKSIDEWNQIRQEGTQIEQASRLIQRHNFKAQVNQGIGILTRVLGCGTTLQKARASYWLAHAPSHWPGHAKYYFEISNGHYLRAGHREGVEKTKRLISFWRSGPWHPQTNYEYFWLMNARFTEGDFLASLEAAKCVEVKPLHGYERKYRHNLMARAYVELGDRKRAWRHLNLSSSGFASVTEDLYLQAFVCYKDRWPDGYDYTYLARQAKNNMQKRGYP